MLELSRNPDDPWEQVPSPIGPEDYGSAAPAPILLSQKVAAGRRLLFTSFRDILLTTANRYVVKGILLNASLVVVWGEPKCGKSFFVFDMTAHVAAGWEYRGHRVKQCPVIYFALEGKEGFAARVEAFRRVHDEADIPFYLSADRIVLPQHGPAIVQSIRDQFPDVRPGIVVLDTLNRSIEGSENSPEDMGAYVRAADAIREAFSCVVIVIHHCGVNGERPRGHTSLTGAADAQIAVKRDAAGNIVATVECMKDGPQGEEIVSRLEQVTVGIDEDGDPITSCIIQPVHDGAVRAKAMTGQAARALQILRDCLSSRDELTAPTLNLPAGTRVVREDTWRTECYARMHSEDTDQSLKQKSFVRARKKLLAENNIDNREGYVWLV
ncbi:AAA family ATPase [Bradyrhizobium diazoefficiens]|uniref:AAA family ATPase n=1 Tax=Bradyrhizobium diazoefficiens TaxID=1355477 RepID=UPI0038334891